jgi:16S rRNA (cytosine1402-N4)-methyltransferase
VLCDEVVRWLRPAAPGLLVDATVGAGGHAAALLAAAPGFQLLGIDRDPAAIAAARERLRDWVDRIELVVAEFGELAAMLDERQGGEPCAVLADLGCSSLQLEDARRGFSFQRDGPLDMRMGPAGTTAADLVNQCSEEELVTILRTYGEEPRTRAIVRAIVEERRKEPLRSTAALAGLVERVVGYRGGRRIHPATRTFQALRIAVNDELGQLETLVEPMVRRLRPGGRIACIAFHSLEDRIVKHTLRRLEGRCVCPPGMPECRCRPERLVKVLTRRPVTPAAEERAGNPRARSARLRVAERLSEDR